MLLESFKECDLRARVGRVAVCCICQERNNRIFSNRFRVKDVVLKDIENSVTAKACNWSCKRISANCSVCRSWEIDEMVLV